MSEQTKNIRKKTNRFFELYIDKISKHISLNCEILFNAKQQLNSILCMIAKIISYKTIHLIEISNKKKINEKVICNAIKLVLPEHIGKNTIMNSQKIIDTLIESDEKGISKKERSGIIFPPSICEKFLRNFGYTKIMVSQHAPIYLTGAIEYLAIEILEKSHIEATNKKHLSINIHDLELGVRNNNELNKFFIQNKLSFLGSGIIVPYICHTKKLVGSNCLTFSKLSFEKIVRKVLIKEHHENTIKISKDVFIVMQYFVEQKLIQLLQYSNFASTHANRVKLLPADIKFIISLYENGIPYKKLLKNGYIEEVNEEDIEEVNEKDIEEVNEKDIEEVNEEDIEEDILT